MLRRPEFEVVGCKVHSEAKATTYLTAAPLVSAIVPVCEAAPGVVYLDTPSFTPPSFELLADSLVAR